MRKAQKHQIEDFIQLLNEAHDEIKRAVEQKRSEIAIDLLEQCQEGAIRIGEMIEESEGEGFVTVSFLENYCELSYQLHEELIENKGISANSIYKKLNKLLLKIEYSVKNDIKVRLEIAFLPYKASMWDSLESIWMAADADPECDAYVVPIPYYERNANRSLGTYHYEGDEMPDYVPVTHYDSYHLEERRPDIIYIHNPYDQGNFVTSVDPRYYSVELKKYTDMLIYVPYYATSGGMSEGQSLCRAYIHVNYIIIQSEKYKKFFDPLIPQEKLLPLGSPKFDKVIRLCDNLPEPPAEWKEKMQGKKVYFFNTSIGGMLGNTELFLKKMEYVFHCFKGREDACLLWRPHPLLESTFDSMRKEFKPFYDKLKQYFLENELGIYDTTPDMDKTIALCDAYIGDSASSVVSMFGITGKPIFILNNNINTLPKEDDWRGEIIRGLYYLDTDEWMITQGNHLYHSIKGDYQYNYYCKLSDYSNGRYYIRAFEIAGRIYVCPGNARDILVIKDKQVEKRIPLNVDIEQVGAFGGAIHSGTYLFILPYKASSIIKYDTVNESVEYISGINEIFIADIQGERRVGGYCIWKDYLLLGSPLDDRVIAININTNQVQLLSIGTKKKYGSLVMFVDGEDVWILPYNGGVIVRWNPETGIAREYSELPEKFQCINAVGIPGYQERPFYSLAFDMKYVYVAPYCGNMFLRIDKMSGEVEEWLPSQKLKESVKDGYFAAAVNGYFIKRSNESNEDRYCYFSLAERKVYEVNLGENIWTEIPIEFDPKELQAKEAGFCEISEWLQYACEENAFSSLDGFLKGEIKGAEFNKERQIKAYRAITANSDGMSGETIHDFACKKLSEKGENLYEKSDYLWYF
ncbi:CDP-glycerol:poly(glycerophosphate) glycerophosphotransferase [Lachnospiraceae bacterium KM106-2]|nr:CDP-glycerol:poly(glycerophosphate) glycerophosphotransferase [Lachnospiraceae bacterium KM106-2]